MNERSGHRILTLDGLRGLAVLQVVVYHYYLLAPLNAGWYHTLQRAGTIVDGLNLFFVLSGFLIGGILLDTRGTPGVMRVFYVRRLYRILPVYLLLLLSYGALRLLDTRFQWGFIYHWYTDIPFWNYLVFWQNYRMVHDQVLGAPWLAVTWSLAVEQQFYLIIPWVINFVSRRALFVLGVCCVVAAPFLRAGVLPQYLLQHRIDALAIGVMAAALIREPAALVWLQRHRSALRTLVIAGLVGLAAGRIAGLTQEFIHSWIPISLLYGLLVCLLSDDTAWRGIKPGLAALAPLGVLSYSVYLFHIPILYLFEAKLPGLKLLALPVTLGFAALTYKYLEKPLIRQGHRQVYRLSAPPAPTA